MSSDPVPIVLEAGALTGATATVSDTPSADFPQVNADVTGPTVVLLDEPTVQLARAAAELEAGRPEQIGEFLVAVAEDDVAITAQFAATQAGYLGWHWSVTVAVVSQDHPTVSEVVLLPGDGALLAPAWVPWEQRIRPGDVGAGDLLPLTADDPRVVPAYLQSDDPAVEAVAAELGIGRVRVLSREGRIDFAERLHDGRFGAADEVALAAPAHCFTCAFYLPLAGSLGQLVGACGNEYSPADGRVVDAGYGCGAHSETVVDMPARSAATDTVIDELALEVHRRPAPLGDPEMPESIDVPAVEPDLLDADLLDSDLLGADLLSADLLDADMAQDELAQAALLDSSDPVPFTDLQD